MAVLSADDDGGCRFQSSVSRLFARGFADKRTRMDFTLNLNVNVSVTSTSALPMTNDYWVVWFDGRGQYMGRIILDTFNVHMN